MAKLIIKDLNKVYNNGVHALRNINLEIENGMFGLLGPNGAGKSSLMRTIATLQSPDSGTIELNGLNVLENQDQLRQVLGYLPQEFGVYPRITAQELLDHLAILKGVTNKKERKELIGYLLQKVNLYEKRNKAVKSFSGGMKQRIGIAQALIGDPKLIIVDEPTAGLDPGERNRFHNLLADVGDSAIVILSTHIVDDVRELCTDMAIMREGEIVYNGSPENVISELDGLVWQKMIPRNEFANYKDQYEIISDKMVAGKTVIHVLSNVDPGNGFKQVEPDLEDVFFTKTSQQFVTN
ncbi:MULTISPECIES: ABC transporter ATP-binding protein [Flammeovirga]|uniref:ABC transporter ATP-binding protein n=1 Tax=Flammeovirga agarivorans TaxID=2726742 RepID=A0A7X8SH86_9BACT|nr:MULTISPECIES: ABC transporter ATP-binding protein [Flammeovirga]NLR90225.1 ABC transporter ATP-binding protein [Flammeovirga agarivorans]